MADKVKQIKEQIKFCKELMLRLDKAVAENIDAESLGWGGIRNHTQIIKDSIRLRRELNVLNKLLNPWGDK
jgi:hypothetical protein